MKATRVFEHTLQAITDENTRLIANRGGTRSGKTFSVVQLLLLVAFQNTKGLAIDIVSESMPHLKRGAIKDASENIDNFGWVEGREYEYNRTDKVLKIGKSTITFFSADDWGKVKGSRRDILFINEANRISHEVFRQLAVRTTFKILIDWNPDAPFWFEEKEKMKAGVKEFVSTYKDNPFLTSQQVAEIESNKGDAEWWKVYGLGQVGNPQGLVYKFEIVQEIPAGAELVGIGVDFGYMADPTAIVAVYKAEGALWLDEIEYLCGMLNPQIAEVLKGIKGRKVADSAEQKSIAELRVFGVHHIEGVQKGKGSILRGIEIVSRYPLKVTAKSLNIIDELRKYKYKTDPVTGQSLGIPIDKYNHALDAVRYVALTFLEERRKAGAPPTARITKIR